MPEPIPRCRACDGVDLAAALDQGVQPLSPAPDPSGNPRSFPLVMNVCRRCGHGQLAFVAAARLRAAADGAAPTKTRRIHLRELADDAAAWTAAERVLDVGCGDGTLLARFQELGCVVEGVEPCARAYRRARERGLSLVRDAWSPAAAAFLSISGARPFDLITVTDVLDRLEDPVNFLRTCVDALAPDGTILVEVPYLSDLVERGAIHRVDPARVSYFLVRSLMALAKRAGLQVSHVIRRPEQGGVLRAFLRRVRYFPEHCQAARALEDAERAAGLFDLATYHALAERLEAGALALRDVAAAARVHGRRVVAYGLSTARLIERLGLRADVVLADAALDPSDYMPGRAVTGQSPRSVADEARGLAVVVAGWLPVEAVRERLRGCRRQRHPDDSLVVVPFNVRASALDDETAQAPAAERPTVFACPTLAVRCRAVPGAGGAA